MKRPNRYYHAIKTVPENCDGCMNCLRSCPSDALRVKSRTPVINSDLCIDCGACIASCPRKAILPDVDMFKKTDAHKYMVAVPSAVFYSQFGLDTTMKVIHLGLNKLGFHFIYDVFEACRIQALAIQEHLVKLGNTSKRPLISSMCPAVIRLIQVRYPTLVSHVIPFEPPRELSAREAKIKVASAHGVDINDVGAYYISPCPAKNTSVMQPAEKEQSFLDGVIAISDIYQELMKAMANLGKDEIDSFPEKNSVFGSGWERAGLMSRLIDIKNWIAVSGLQHVMGILDNIEEGKLDSVSFVEANTCLEGCVGGSLCVENIFIARSKTLMLENGKDEAGKPDPDWVHQLYESGHFFMEKELEPRPKKKTDSSIPDAILLMKKRDEIAQNLPGLDCCVCGSPSCLTFAEDVVLGESELDSCPYLGNKNEQHIAEN